MMTYPRTRSLWLASISVALLASWGCEERSASNAPATGEAAMKQAISEAPCCPPTAERAATVAGADAPAAPCCPAATERTTATVAAGDPPPPPCCPPTEASAVATTQPTTQPSEPAAAAPVSAPEAAAQASVAEKARAGDWLAPEQRDKPFYLDFDVTDQTGQAMKLADLKGKPTVVTFLFTRCPNPQMCPMIAAGLAHLQRATVAAGIDKDVQLVAISYDPAYDTPERLKAYGERFGIQWTNARLLRPTLEQYKELIQEFAIDVRPTVDGNINHRIELIVMDAQGRYVRDYQAAIWDSKDVVEDLKKLIAEKRVDGAMSAR